MKATLSCLARMFAVLILLGCAKTMYADTTYYFSFDGSGINASGSVTASPLGGGEYLITSLTGTQNGEPMTLVAPDGYGGNDNDFFTTAPFLDGLGVTFSLPSLTDYNVYFAGTYLECNSVDNNPCETGDGVPLTSGSLSLTPEPGTLVLFGTGLLGLAALLRRKGLA
jgi:PEP-CTERM motif